MFPDRSNQQMVAPFWCKEGKAGGAILDVAIYMPTLGFLFQDIVL
tara:strand:+ start:331 stop:465 length:135 start_codon:yes stop_codon:yes gene_type:complete